MNFKKADFERGHAVCDQDGCEKLHILESGTDYRKDQWVMCKRCASWVVVADNEGSAGDDSCDSSKSA